MRPATKNRFRFDAYSGDVCSGAFSLAESTLRLAFAHISDVGVYGFRRLERDGTYADVDMVDGRRRGFEDMCVRYGRGRAELTTFQQLIEPGTGLVINSLQNPASPGPNPFNDIAEMFVDAHGYPPHAYPETLEMVLFLGRYVDGFGRHRDPYDTTMFVLDGRKHFIVEDAGGDRSFTIGKGRYLRWRSANAHHNFNPNMEWSMSLHFTQGPDERRGVLPGTPVDYTNEATKLKDLVESMATAHAQNQSASPGLASE